jgi:hypothetical protein
VSLMMILAVVELTHSIKSQSPYNKLGLGR